MRTPLPSARELSQGFVRVSNIKTLLLNLLRENFHTAAERCKDRAGTKVTKVFMMIGKKGWQWSSSDKDGKTDPCPELNCSEFNEADQRMLVTVRHFTGTISRDGGNVVLASEDADVCVAATSFYKRLVEPGVQGLYILRGGSNPNLYDVRHVVTTLDYQNGEGFHEVLLALHVLTGCDSTSSFYKRSKVGAFNNLAQLYRSGDDRGCGDNSHQICPAGCRDTRWTAWNGRTHEPRGSQADLCRWYMVQSSSCAGCTAVTCPRLTRRGRTCGPRAKRTLWNYHQLGTAFTSIYCGCTTKWRSGSAPCCSAVTRGITSP